MFNQFLFVWLLVILLVYLEETFRGYMIQSKIDSIVIVLSEGMVSQNLEAMIEDVLSYFKEQVIMRLFLRTLLILFFWIAACSFFDIHDVAALLQQVFDPCYFRLGRHDNLAEWLEVFEVLLSEVVEQLNAITHLEVLKEVIIFRGAIFSRFIIFLLQVVLVNKWDQRLLLVAKNAKKLVKEFVILLGK